MNNSGFFFEVMMVITALCKVVDNFGDVGVVWRLCKNLISINKDIEINLVIDDLISFNKICKDVKIDSKYQMVCGINIYDWKDYDFCYKEFSTQDGYRLSVILECFQCGRPDWMEKILFEDKLERTSNIIMIDYLTAEKYAEDFHCLDSLTRSKKVKKINFMPGFTEKTGGLIIDDAWKEMKDWNPDGKILVFTYERDWSPLAAALMKTGKKTQVAQGRGKDSFVAAANSIEYEIMPYLDQEEWDKQMQNSSVLIIRGEETMSRACLSGIPFVWHAYPQSDEYQLVKVNALLDRMSKHFKTEDFKKIRKVWLCFNSPENEVSNNEMEKACTEFLLSTESLVYGFKDFAADLRKNGDLCSNLMTFIEKKCIIE